MRLFVCETVDQLADSGAIAFAHAGLDEFRFCVRARQVGVNGVTLRDGRVEVGLDLAGVHRARADRLDQLVALGDHFVELLIQRAAVCAPLLARRHKAARILLAKDLKQFGIEQIVAQTKEDHLFETCLRHGEPVRAKALVLIGRAAEVLPGVLRISAAANAALDNARDQIFDRAMLPVGAIDRDATILLGFDPIPERLLHNAQMLSLVNNPALLRIYPHDAPVGVGVTVLADAIPHDPAGIHLVVDDAGAAFAIAEDRAVGPPAPRW